MLEPVASPSAVPGTVGLPAPAVETVVVQDKRAERAYRRAQKAAEKQAAKAAKKAARSGVPLDLAPAEQEPAPATRVPAPSALLAAQESA